VEIKQDWAKKFLIDRPEWLEWYRLQCLHLSPIFKAFTYILMSLYNQSGGTWDDETGEVKGFCQFGYDGEDFLDWDLNTSTWIALRPEAVIAKPIWAANKDLGDRYKTYVTQIYPEWLKTCLATGFYPHRASLVWRKDGEELHEEVDHGEILPNHDGTFQMSVDLNLSSVTPEDWTRYDCVFQLSGVKEDIITKLEKDRIRTNKVHGNSCWKKTKPGVTN
uniref:Ig-like domain-containing protein n=1 Tax=Sparus aurata TaxID=8175 RepID=A0A671TI67_SPAAU